MSVHEQLNTKRIIARSASAGVSAKESITEVKTEDGKVKGIFDLAGRLIENPTTGIYIVNGKKVVK